ncbi:hypothetical protein KP509_26G008700 [Ceratopteris richardii]|uniref:Thymidylate kinase n=1 Tax=Ceratopteris richardii TaxID=49495 RepID=A0A8T2RKH8_CERRI|nr:hypothetical protein KP509_26G008700 [Ceratopteris richardii]
MRAFPARNVPCYTFMFPASALSRIFSTTPAMVVSMGLSASESRGAFIVLEGLDRSGKSSQCANLLSFLNKQGIAAEAWRFPDRSTGIGNMISSYLSSSADLDDRTVHLLFSANRWEKSSLLETKLREGTTLVVDRYSYSGVAFSAAKGLDFNWCKAPDEGLPAADLVLYLNISPEIAAARGGYGAERYENLNFQKKVANCYKRLQDSTWKTIDATKSIDDVQEDIRKAVLLVIAKCSQGQELHRLWSTNSE